MGRVTISDSEVIDKKFNFLTAIKRVPSRNGRRFLFRCDCGRYHEANIANVLNGNTKSCGCYRNDGLFVQPGMRFGSYTTIIKKTGSHQHWICRCDCGTVEPVKTSRLRCKHGHLPHNLHCAKCGSNKLNYPPTPDPYPKKCLEILEANIDLLKPFSDHSWKYESAYAALWRSCWIAFYKPIPEKKIRGYLWSWVKHSTKDGSKNNPNLSELGFNLCYNDNFMPI